MSEDTSTLTLAQLDSGSRSGSGLSLVPALTIAWHPNTSRVGDIAPLTELIENETAPLMRREPLFYMPGSDAGRPVDHLGMSRDPVLFVASFGQNLELRPGPTAAKLAVEIDGTPFSVPRRVTPEELQQGMVLTVARKFVFILHRVHFPISRSPTLGLVGVGDGIEDVRRLITKFAPIPAAVLIRGESGTGKEVVAKALHETSPRRQKRFVPVNMALMRPERASAELFGYEKGAFTGATGSYPGHFQSAHGGTLFLDEIGLTPPDVQPMLLRVLEDQKVQPLGAPQPRLIDVRIVTATDSRLEEAVKAGGFERALFNRLNSSLQIGLPPLRSRREDIGLLLVTFLKEGLAALNALSRLAEPPGKTDHWLPARTVAAICSSEWSANIRALKGLALDLAVRSADGTSFNADNFVVSYLRSQLALAPTSRNSDAPAPRARMGEISNDQILDAFDQAGWNISQAAKVLSIDKSTLSRRLAKEPSLQILAKASLANLIRRKEACGLDTLAEQLGVPSALLARRLRLPLPG